MIYGNSPAECVAWASVLRLPPASTWLAEPVTALESEARDLATIGVLVAHSDPLVSAGVVAILGEQGFSVRAQPPKATVNCATPSGFNTVDVIVADYESGLRLINAREVWSKRIVILTHRDSQASIFQALQQGIRGYLLLGCSASDLVSGVQLVQGGGTAFGPVVAARIAERMTQPALTSRQEQVLRQLELGLSNKQIASKLFMAVGTVKVHVKSILEKLGAATRTQAVMLAQRRGILAQEGDSLHRADEHPGPGERHGKLDAKCHATANTIRSGFRSARSGGDYGGQRQAD